MGTPVEEAPDPDVSAAEMVEDLLAALEHFEQMAGDLNGKRGDP